MIEIAQLLATCFLSFSVWGVKVWILPRSCLKSLESSAPLGWGASLLARIDCIKLFVIRAREDIGASPFTLL